MKFTVKAVCISHRKGIQKHPVDSLHLIENFGIEKDAHAGDRDRQVSFLADENIDTMRAVGLILEPGAFGENVVTRGIDWAEAKVGGKIVVGDAELKITKIGKECHTPCSIYKAVGRCIMPEVGVFARVEKGGTIHAESSGYYSI